MESKMLEKWTAKDQYVYSGAGREFTALHEAAAELICKSANHSIDQAYAAGLEAGKAQAVTKPAEPAPMVLTDVEKVVWGQVYAAALSVYESKELDNSHVLAMEAADAAIAALRVRSAPGQVARLKPQNDGLLDHCIAIDKNAKQVQFELNQAQTRIAELETQVAKATAAERARCAGIAKAMGDGAESRMKMGSDSRDAFDEGVSSTSKVILRRILNPTT